MKAYIKSDSKKTWELQPRLGKTPDGKDSKGYYYIQLYGPASYDLNNKGKDGRSFIKRVMLATSEDEICIDWGGSNFNVSEGVYIKTSELRDWVLELRKLLDS